MGPGGSVRDGIRRVPLLSGLTRRVRWLLNRLLGSGPRIEALESHVNQLWSKQGEPPEGLSPLEEKVTVNSSRIRHNEKRLDDLERHMPQLLNAISSFGGVARRMDMSRRCNFGYGCRIGEFEITSHAVCTLLPLTI